MNNRKKWTTSEDQLLKQLFVSHDYENMAKRLHRTVDAVKARFVKIYLYDKGIKETYGINTNDFLRYLKYAGVDIAESEEYEESSEEYEESSEESSEESEESSEEYEESSEESSEEVSQSREWFIMKLHLNFELNLLHVAIVIGFAFIMYMLHKEQVIYYI
jgi:hypothetical protein